MTNTIALNHSAKEERQRQMGHFSFSLIVAIMLLFCVNVIYSSIRAASSCLGDLYIDHFKDFTRLFQGAILEFQALIFSLDTKQL